VIGRLRLPDSRIVLNGAPDDTLSLFPRRTESARPITIRESRRRSCIRFCRWALERPTREVGLGYIARASKPYIPVRHQFIRVTQKLWEPERMEACVISSERGRPDYAEPVTRARAGDLAAFEELYRENAGRVYAICLRMTADPSRAEELTQEAFVRAWEKLGSFRGSGAFGGWLRRLVINVVLADRRARGRRLARETETEDVARFRQPGEPAPPPAAMDLEAAIAKLPPGARTVFLLHDVEGYRHDEIAKMLRVASGTSKTQLHRARKLLREALKS